jgi:hypothetical protein
MVHMFAAMKVNDGAYGGRCGRWSGLKVKSCFVWCACAFFWQVVGQTRTRKTLDVRRERYNTKGLVMVEEEEEEEGVGSKLAERIDHV